MYAFLDSAGDVLALSKSDRTLEFAQAVNPDIVERVDGAPENLLYKGRTSSYHRRDSGDGTSADDYVLVDDLTQLRATRVAEIDAKTSELIYAGFEFPPGSGNCFSASAEMQRTLQGLYAVKDHPATTYPVVWSTSNDDSTVTLDGPADVEMFYLTGLGTIRAHKDAGTALKVAVAAAATAEQINAVVDDRGE